MITEIVFLGRDNAFTFSVLHKGAALDTSAITRAVITVGTETVDSSVDATAITWDAVGNFTCTLGSTLTREGTQNAIVVLYDPLTPNGFVVSHPSLPDTTLQIKKVGQ